MGEEQKQDNNKAKPEATDPSSEQPKNPSNDCSKNEAAAGNKEAKNNNGEEKKDEAPPPPPEEIIMRVFMHCEGCARKVQRCLRACDGVEDVLTDCRAHTVVVKGKVAAADPLKVVERLQRKTGRKVELLTPVPPKPEEKEEKKVEVEPPKPEEKKEEPPVIYVVLKVYMHCEACSMEIKKRILKMKGVQSVEADLKASEVAVTGVIEAPALVDYVYKRTGKHAAVVKQEVVEKKQEEAEKGKEEEKKDEEGDTKADNSDKGKDGDGNGDSCESAGDGGEVQFEDAAAAAMAAKAMEMRRNEMYYYYYYPRYQVEHAYPPQMFSDENPNACSVM